MPINSFQSNGRQPALSNLWRVMKSFSMYGTVVKRLEMVASGGEGPTEKVQHAK